MSALLRLWFRLPALSPLAALCARARRLFSDAISPAPAPALLGCLPRARSATRFALRFALTFALLGLGQAVQAEVPVSRPRVVAQFPHDVRAFTQGLAFIDGRLYEGTGGYGASSLRRVDLETGRVLERVDLPKHLFGEGITGWQDEVVQLTWRAGLGLRYSRAPLQQRAQFRIDGEGWGLTHDGRRWIMSDGSARLRFLDPATGAETGSVTVAEGAKPVIRLNELEYVDGEVWANIWYRDRIVRIDPSNGQVLGYLDLAHLWPAGKRRRSEQVLNGIAFDAKRSRLLVTGKRWPWLYQLERPALPSESGAGRDEPPDAAQGAD